MEETEKWTKGEIICCPVLQTRTILTSRMMRSRGEFARSAIIYRGTFLIITGRSEILISVTSRGAAIGNLPNQKCGIDINTNVCQKCSKPLLALGELGQKI